MATPAAPAPTANPWSNYSPQQITAMTTAETQAQQLAQAQANWNANNSGSRGITFDGTPSANGTVLNGLPNGIQYADYVPGWNSGMSLAQKYQDQVAANSEGFNKMRSEALTPGPTQWATNERLRQNALSMQAKDSGAASVAGQTAQADDALAAQGGLSSGARERVAEGGAKNAMSMTQGVNTAGLNNDLQIGSTDESNKMGMLGQVAGQENQRSANWMQANQYDQGQQTAENERLNAYNQHLADQKNNAYAAQQTANATANSGK